jgi:hypothetical protein
MVDHLAIAQRLEASRALAHHFAWFGNPGCSCHRMASHPRQHYFLSINSFIFEPKD